MGRLKENGLTEKPKTTEEAGAIGRGGHMRVPFFDLGRQTGRIRKELSEAIMDVIDSNQLILGTAVGRAEQEIAKALSVEHAIGVASGSDALLLSLMAAGIGPGDEVIVPTFSFFSTASSPLRLGARIVFADIDFRSFQMDPDEFRRRITSRTRAVIVTHLYGDCADVLRIQAIAADHGILIIEDAAQAFGAKHRGRYAATMGFCGCLSFYPTKNLAAIGDAGMVVTNDEGAAKRLRLLRAHGAEDRYEHKILGVNSRLDSIQAAALSVRLPYVEEWNQRRRAIAARYIGGLDGVISVPTPDESNEPVYNQFVIRTPERDALLEHLQGHGIGTQVYYPIPLHLQEGLAPMTGNVGDFPRAEEAARTCLALPIFPELRDEEVDHVIEKIREFCLQ
jgi:dTDP-4-amino-4,6-dideoxygalactose transaminase